MLTPQMVGVVGLEPTRPEGHQLLRLARLPIPPHADKLKTGNTLATKMFCYDLLNRLYWWRRWDLNPQPSACKADALPIGATPPLIGGFRDATR